MGYGKSACEVEEVVHHKERGKYYVANRAEEVPASRVEKIGNFYWTKRWPEKEGDD